MPQKSDARPWAVIKMSNDTVKAVSADKIMSSDGVVDRYWSRFDAENAADDIIKAIVERKRLIQEGQLDLFD